MTFQDRFTLGEDLFVGSNMLKNVLALTASSHPQDKLHRREYATVTQLESDLKRLIINAKSYNARNSDIFSNAEKLRKMLATHMNRINPAYHDGSGYMPFPTPIPEKKENETVEASHSKEDENDIDADGETDPEESAEKHQPSATSIVDDPLLRRATSTPAVQENVDAEKGFDGLTFQEAQDKIVGELIQRKDDECAIISINLIIFSD